MKNEIKKLYKGYQKYIDSNAKEKQRSIDFEKWLDQQELTEPDNKGLSEDEIKQLAWEYYAPIGGIRLTSHLPYVNSFVEGYKYCKAKPPKQEPNKFEFDKEVQFIIDEKDNKIKELEDKIGELKSQLTSTKTEQINAVEFAKYLSINGWHSSNGYNYNQIRFDTQGRNYINDTKRAEELYKLFKEYK